MADKEWEQLLADHSSTTKDLLKELRCHNKKYDSSSSDDEEENHRPAKKKKKSMQSELFTLDSELKSPAQYQGMDMSNLVMHSQIPNDIFAKIATNKFFDLQELFSGAELSTANANGYKTKNVNAKPISKKSEIFYLLYTFGMYYLQLFPQKAAGFLEYLAYLTKFGAPFNVPGLLKLDSALRVHYIKHPEWNWDQNNVTIYRTFDLLSRNPKIGSQVGRSLHTNLNTRQKGRRVRVTLGSSSKLMYHISNQQCHRVQAPASLTIHHHTSRCKYPPSSKTTHSPYSN